MLLPFDPESLERSLEQQPKTIVVHAAAVQKKCENKDIRTHWWKQMNLDLSLRPALQVSSSQRSMQMVDLSNMRITDIDLKNKLSELANCVRLNLSNNEIRSLIDFPPKLKFLNLSGNPLKGKTFTIENSNLEELDMTNTTLGGTVWFKAKKLHVLNLGDNKIKNFRLLSKSCIKVLKLNDNDVGHISDILDDLNKFTKLEDLDLRHNPFRENESKYSDFEYLKMEVKMFVPMIQILDEFKFGQSFDKTYLTDIVDSPKSSIREEFLDIELFLNSQLDGGEHVHVHTVIYYKALNLTRNGYSSFGFFLDSLDGVSSEGNFADSPIFIHLKIPDFATNEIAAVTFWPGKTYRHKENGFTAPVMEAEAAGYDSLFISIESVFLIFKPANIIAEYSVKFDRIS